jgi:diguanylate cyclase (GGDEF)-like protein
MKNPLKKDIPPKNHINLWQKITQPHSSIIDISKRRQASLISALTFFLSIGITSGVIYMGLFSLNQYVGRFLIIAQCIFLFSYFLSRTKYNSVAAILALSLLLIIPIFDVGLSIDHSPEVLLILLIWNIATVLMASAIGTFKITVYTALFNFITISFFPLFLKNVTYQNLIVPLVFNFLIPLMIIIFTDHRNKLENDHLEQISQINSQLEFELSERKKIEEKLAHYAMHDPLTDLPNRILFMDRLSHAKSYSRRHSDFTFAVCFIDMDRFKVINDSLGHKVGDMLIIESAKRILSCVRDSDTVCRLGGDEFVLLLEGAEEPENYLTIVNRIQKKLLEPTEIDGYTVYISVSIGIVLDTENYETADELLRNADVAMYETKKEGRGHYRIFDESMLEGVMTRIEIENDLRNALPNNEFILHYQPILDIHTKKIIGFEALIRWIHPEKGLIPPIEFIGIIEEMGLIVPIGYWVIDEATRQIKQWQDEFDESLSININLSTRQCTQSDLAERIGEIIEENQLDPSTVKLELTESLIIKDMRAISKTLQKLRNLGVQVQIDDFGTGYSSLGYLPNLPIDTLKIDRTFVSRLGIDANSADIVQTILALAHGMGMQVIAEGVETEQQLAMLESMKCEFVQGFLFAKPLTEEDARKMLGNS